MVQINLLPPEIIERRKYDRYYPYIFIVAGILVAVIAVVWITMQLLVSQQTQVLQQTKESTAQVNAQAESLAIFEQKRGELEARQEIADAALTGRIDMGGLAEDISLVLPEEIFTSRLKADEQSGLEIDGYSPISGLPNVKSGYKSIAACLVRLSSLDSLKDVWLTSAEVKMNYNIFQPVERTQDASATVMQFFSTGKIVPPPVDEGE